MERLTGEEISALCEEILAFALKHEEGPFIRETDDIAVYHELRAGNDEVIVETIRAGGVIARKICRQKYTAIPRRSPIAAVLSRETYWALERLAA